MTRADPPLKHGPYPQISFNSHGKSTTQSVRADEVAEVRQQLKNYHHLRDLVDEWISLGLGVVAAPASRAPERG